ncbi:MAG: hypothetical protein IJ071_08670 [Ruminococcus sp.]|nr:hypothetical protein [Ruminococcus sp.]
MKKTEKQALARAFDLPDPERKDEFFRELSYKRRRPVALIVRFASVAAMAVLAVGLWGHFRGSAPDRTPEPDGQIVTVTTTTAEAEPAVTTQTSAAGAAVDEDPEDPHTDVRTTAVSTARATENNTRHTTRASVSPAVPRQTAPARTSPPARTAAPQRTTAAAVRTTAVSTKVETVTTVPATEAPITDLTIEPENVYEKKDFVVDIEYLRPRFSDGEALPPGQEEPVGQIQTSPKDAVMAAAKDCDTAVIGEVQNVFYFVDSGAPYTQIDLLVTDPLLGELEENYLISVVLGGGYIAPKDLGSINSDDLEDLRDEFGDREISIRDLGERTDEQDPHEGDTFLLLLNDIGRGYCFVTPNDEFSVLPVDGDKVSLKGKSFPLDEILELINK